MRFTPSRLRGAFVIDIEPIEDERGFFARTWCQREFAAHGIEAAPVQASLSFNRRRGTLRGVHFQWPPSLEGKIVRCTRGSIFDVLVDLRGSSARDGSGAFLSHDTVVLSSENRRAVYIPPGLGHGFQTLEDDTEVEYHMTDDYRPDLAGGIRWNDPAMPISWPLEPTVMNERDRGYPNLDRERFEAFRNY